LFGRIGNRSHLINVTAHGALLRHDLYHHKPCRPGFADSLGCAAAFGTGDWVDALKSDENTVDIEDDLRPPVPTHGIVDGVRTKQSETGASWAYFAFC
jgi:hypothetical protein